MTNRQFLNKNVIIILLILIIIGLGSYILLSKNINQNTLESQISAIRYQLSFVDGYHDACNFAALLEYNNPYSEDKKEEVVKKCASSLEFIEFSRNLVAEPQLTETKIALLELADLLDELSIEILIHGNLAVRDRLDREIPIQRSRVLEELRRVELGI